MLRTEVPISVPQFLVLTPHFGCTTQLRYALLRLMRALTTDFTGNSLRDGSRTGRAQTTDEAAGLLGRLARGRSFTPRWVAGDAGVTRPTRTSCRDYRFRNDLTT